MSDTLARWRWPLIMVVLAWPAAAARTGLISMPVAAETLVNGLAIVAAAFILTWIAEAAERDVPRTLALAGLALVAVLPEYAVDVLFAWKAGKDPSYAAFATANMTGGNRLLVGLGWPMVVGIFWFRTGGRVLALAEHHRTEVGILAIATVYSFVIPVRGGITLLDSAFLGALFLAYVVLASRGEIEEESVLVGPSETIANLPKMQRRMMVIALFLYAGFAILIAAEPFAEGLIETGTRFGIDEFTLVQWVAPLASEFPEFLVAGLLAWRLRADAGARCPRIVEGQSVDAANRLSADRVRHLQWHPGSPADGYQAGGGDIPYRGAEPARGHLVDQSADVTHRGVRAAAVVRAAVLDAAQHRAAQRVLDDVLRVRCHLPRPAVPRDAPVLPSDGRRVRAPRTAAARSAAVSDATALYAASRAKHAERDTAGSIELARQAVELDPKYAEALEHLGTLLITRRHAYAEGLSSSSVPSPPGPTTRASGTRSDGATSSPPTSSPAATMTPGSTLASCTSAQPMPSGAASPSTRKASCKATPKTYWTM